MDSEPVLPRGRDYVVGLCASFPELREADPPVKEPRGRRFVIGFCARCPELRQDPISLDDRTRGHVEGIMESLHTDDIALLPSITDEEVAEMQALVAAQFEHIYPAGI